MNVTEITPERLHELHEQGEPAWLIDVRSPSDYGRSHVPFAVNIPLESLDAASLASLRNGASDDPLYVICRSGNRSAKGCAALASEGMTNVASVAGGTTAWEKAGYATTRGKKSVSLERQVRIAAGGMVLAGAVLALAVHPYFAALSGLIGAGLVFSGVTDTCGMAMMLARMPWNQVRDKGCATESGASSERKEAGGCCSH